MTSEWSIKCPLASMVLEKGERERNKNIKKEHFFFVRNVLLYIQWQSQLFSQTPAHAHSFILVMLISNTSVKCRSYIYLYIMKELKMCCFFSGTIYSIMNSNRHENINIIMMQTSQRSYPQFSLLRLETDYTSKLRPCSQSKHKIQFHAAFIALQ